MQVFNTETVAGAGAEFNGDDDYNEDDDVDENDEEEENEGQQPDNIKRLIINNHFFKLIWKVNLIFFLLNFFFQN